MLILIAESKTMLASERDVSPSDFAKNTPIYAEVADGIAGSLRGLNPAELSEAASLSGSLAAKMQKMMYEFGYKATGYPAIEAFTGVVFKNLDFSTLSPEEKNRCNECVRIISSLYGWLRPEDIIKPYRLDFTTKLPEGPSAGKALNTFWKADVTKALVRCLQQENQSEILNLLPADAAKCIDWKLTKRFAKVWKVDFQEIQEGDKMKTPTANRLKALRGQLLRQILKENITSADQLLHTASDHYVCEGTPKYPDHLQFLC